MLQYKGLSPGRATRLLSEVSEGLGRASSRGSQICDCVCRKAEDSLLTLGGECKLNKSSVGIDALAAFVFNVGNALI